MMPSRRIAPALLGLVTVAVLSGCGSPEYEYVRNTQARTAFKVPHEWTVFDEATMQGDLQGSQAGPDPVEWLVGLDADPAPAREHVLTPDAGFRAAYPNGIAGVYRISSSVRDRLNLSELRNLILPIDTIRDEVGADAVVLLAYDDRLEVDGFRGLHFEAQVSVPAVEQVMGSGSEPIEGGPLVNDDYLHINQTAYMDPGSDKVYILAVLCSADCYERNRGEIETVVQSWAVTP
jgi:hypothetical protein